MQTNHFLLLTKLKNTESAQLWDIPSGRAGSFGTSDIKSTGLIMKKKQPWLRFCAYPRGLAKKSFSYCLSLDKYVNPLVPDAHYSEPVSVETIQPFYKINY